MAHRHGYEPWRCFGSCARDPRPQFSSWSRTPSTWWRDYPLTRGQKFGAWYRFWTGFVLYMLLAPSFANSLIDGLILAGMSAIGAVIGLGLWSMWLARRAQR